MVDRRLNMKTEYKNVLGGLTPSMQYTIINYMNWIDLMQFRLVNLETYLLTASPPHRLNNNVSAFSVEFPLLNILSGIIASNLTLNEKKRRFKRIFDIARIEELKFTDFSLISTFHKEMGECLGNIPLKIKSLIFCNNYIYIYIYIGELKNSSQFIFSIIGKLNYLSDILQFSIIDCNIGPNSCNSIFSAWTSSINALTHLNFRNIYTNTLIYIYIYIENNNMGQKGIIFLTLKLINFPNLSVLNLSKYQLNSII